jgi:hypothetical protein
MKVYVATAFTDKHIAQHWMSKLREIDVSITHDWTTAEQPARGELELSLVEQQHHARADAAGVFLADVVWVLAPAVGGTGCWFEMGVAAGLQMMAPKSAPYLLISGPSRRSIFTSLFHYIETHDAAFKVLEMMAKHMPASASAKGTLPALSALLSPEPPITVPLL